MIDIISSSIRLGRYLRNSSDYTILYDFYNNQINNKEIAYSYKSLLEKGFFKYGFHGFDYARHIINEGFNSPDPKAAMLAKPIKEFLDEQPNYDMIIEKSKELGSITDKYIADLITNINTFPLINISTKSLKLQQLSNELSTSIIRSGVLHWLTEPNLHDILKKESDFITVYERETESIRTVPYCKKIRKYISKLDPQKQQVAQAMENISFIQHIVKNGLVQGFFFELYDFPEERIVKIKEINKEKSIHAISLKLDFAFPNEHIMLFRYTFKNKVNYLLADRINIRFRSGESCTTTIRGCCYPTNEYLLFKK